MKVAIVCNDTRGGVQPYVALGAGLAGAGHEVRIVAPQEFSPMIGAAGLRFAGLSKSREEIVEISAGAAERGTLATMRLMLTELPERVALWTAETLEGCEGADLLLGGIGGMITGIPVAEKLGVPFVQAHLQPVGVPTAAFPGVLVAGVPIWWGDAGRRLSHFVSDAGVRMQFQGAAGTARQVLKLTGPTRSADPRLTLFGFSPFVVPVPPSPTREVTGYWTSSAPDWSPPADLAAFMERRDKPVVSVGFGSMTSGDPAALVELVVGAAADAGVRVVLLSGWARLDHLNDSDLHLAESVPHDWLFPRMSAVVHHGGAGTTGAAFMAGVPQIVVPFAVDQPFWASRVAALGVGPKGIPRKRLSRELLATALRSWVEDGAIRATAERLGSRIGQEDGVKAAVGRIEGFWR